MTSKVNIKYPLIEVHHFNTEYYKLGDPFITEIKSTAMSAMALDWPKNRLRTYILDHSHRGDIRKLADSLGCTYLPDPENSVSVVATLSFGPV